MKTWKWLPAAIIAIAGLFLVSSQVKPAEFAEALKNISPLWAATGLCLALAGYGLKSFRFGLFLKPDISPVRLFGATIAQNVIAQLIPARAGDVGFIVILRRMKMAGAGQGIVSLLASRILDAVVLFLMYLWSVWMLDFQTPVFRLFAELFAALVAAALIFIILILLNRRRASRIIERLLARFKSGWLAEIRIETSAALSGGKRIRIFRHIILPLLLSIAIWSVSASWIYLLWRSVGVILDIPQLLFLLSFSQMLGLLPLFIFGGIGALDGINTLALVSFGLASSDAAAFSLCNRAVSLIYLLIMTLIALLLTGGACGASKSYGKKTDDPKEQGT